MYAEKPKKPRRNASFAEVEQYNEAMAFWRSQQNQQQPQRTRQFGTGEIDATNRHTGPVHGTTESGRPVTASFGIGSQEGRTFLADGHVESSEEFWGDKKNKGHEDYDGRGGGTTRGKYHDH